MRIKQLATRGALADVSLAVLSSVVTVLGTVAFAAMIFSGPSSKAVPLAFLSLPGWNRSIRIIDWFV